jgi:hypothetical protein
LITAASVKADAVTKIQGGLSTFDATSDEVTLTAAYDAAATAATQDSVDALALAVGEIEGGLDAAGMRAAIGMDDADMDTQLDAIKTVVDALAPSAPVNVHAETTIVTTGGA